MLKKPLVRLGVLGLMLLGSALAFYLISPLFVRANFGYDGWPTLGLMPTRTPKPPTATLAPMDTQTPQPLTTEFNINLLEGDTALLLASGQFYSVAQAGRGTANIYQVDNVGLVLRLEAFEVDAGSHLYVYLTSAETVKNTSGIALADGFDLGALKGLTGDQSYELPADLDLTVYHSVVIWSAADQVPFIAAPLETPQ